MDSKTRKLLSGKGQTLDPIFQVGKNALDGVIVEEISSALEARELIKIAVLRNCDYSAREISDELCDRLGAEPVSCVGSKIVIYRRSSRKDVKHLL